MLIDFDKYYPSVVPIEKVLKTENKRLVSQIFFGLRPYGRLDTTLRTMIRLNLLLDRGIISFGNLLMLKKLMDL